GLPVGGGGGGGGGEPAGAGGDPAAPRPGAAQPGRDRTRLVDLGRASRPRASGDPRAVRRTPHRSVAGGYASRRRAGAGGDRVVRELARYRGLVEGRAVRNRHRPLRLVPAERAAAPVHLA